MFDLNALGNLFKALGEPNRFKILHFLCRSEEPRKVSDVCCCCDVDLSVISRNLKTLKESGVLRSFKKGKEVYYQVNQKELVSTLRNLADYIENCCDQKGGES